MKPKDNIKPHAHRFVIKRGTGKKTGVSKWVCKLCGTTTKSN